MGSPMTLFLIGLLGFFGLHFYSALRSRADGKDLRKRLGEARYMGLYSLLSLAFFVVMLIGYGRLAQIQRPKPCCALTPKKRWNAELSVHRPSLLVTKCSSGMTGWIMLKKR